MMTDQEFIKAMDSIRSADFSDWLIGADIKYHQQTMLKCTFWSEKTGKDCNLGNSDEWKDAYNEYIKNMEYQP